MSWDSKQLGKQAWYLHLCLQEMIEEADRNGDGQIDEEEFYRIMKKTSLF
jgi:hypothetical protein